VNALQVEHAMRVYETLLESTKHTATASYTCYQAQGKLNLAALHQRYGSMELALTFYTELHQTLSRAEFSTACEEHLQNDLFQMVLTNMGALLMQMEAFSHALDVLSSASNFAEELVRRRCKAVSSAACLEQIDSFRLARSHRFRADRMSNLWRNYVVT
jgi:hypothetical protein